MKFSFIFYLFIVITCATCVEHAVYRLAVQWKRIHILYNPLIRILYNPLADRMKNMVFGDSLAIVGYVKLKRYVIPERNILLCFFESSSKQLKEAQLI